MDGIEQTQVYAELARPLGGIKLGDAVRLPSIDAVFEVVGIADPVLTLRAPSGREVKAGWRAVRVVSQKSRARKQSF